MLLFSDPKHSAQDVLVTGLGIICPLAADRESSWSRLLAGVRACRQLTSDEIDHADQLSVVLGRPAAGAPLDHGLIRTRLGAVTLPHTVADEVSDAWLNEPLTAMTLVALHEAAEDAGLSLPFSAGIKSACFLGASKGALRTVESLTQLRLKAFKNAEENCDRSGHDTSGAQWWHAFQTDAATRAIAAVCGVTERISCPVAACATGLVSILQAAAAIHSGACDICIAGSSDAALRASVLSSFNRLRVTSRHADPQSACRPFDVSRDGFLVGEGSAVIILESRRHADARGARAYGQVTAGGWLNDPSGMTQIDSSGRVVRELISRTLRSLNGMPHRGSTEFQRSSGIACINVHGTGTETNDLAEASGIRLAFGRQTPVCTGFKGAFGHLLGAAGSVETALMLMALRDQQFPGTANLSSPDPRFQIPVAEPGRRIAALPRIMKLSLGFGGHSAIGIFDQIPEERGGRRSVTQ